MKITVESWVVVRTSLHNSKPGISIFWSYKKKLSKSLGIIQQAQKGIVWLIALFLP